LPPSTEFDRFYAEYPKKEGKKAAREAFDKAGIENVEVVIADVRRRKSSQQWLKSGGEFIPLPATYLNNRRWEDGSVSQLVVPWFKEAGFETDWEAENARCFSHNYRSFRDGRRIEEVA
jgi:glutaredoxin